MPNLDLCSTHTWRFMLVHAPEYDYAPARRMLLPSENESQR